MDKLIVNSGGGCQFVYSTKNLVGFKLRHFLFIPFLTFLGKATISNDGATIISLLDVVHPAAKTLVDISKSQDAEVCRFVSLSLTQ